VFVDDNPAEIEIVRQFAPEVATILLGNDPADYAGQLQDCGFFEPRSITGEDARRTAQYHAESQRRSLGASHADMDSYLASLEMEAEVRAFTPVDVPRLAQLINKSNQFNLTTRRRTEAEVLALVNEPSHICLSFRLRDRFGDHGLISIVIGRVEAGELQIDTWLMSCRVLKRQVEETVLNELARRASARGCSRLKGVYLPTAKNEMVRNFYPKMGFQAAAAGADREEYTLELADFVPRTTRVTVREAK
jgi:FkbH-like protein